MWRKAARGIALGLGAFVLGVPFVRAVPPSRPLPPQTGTPALRNFRPKEYGAGQQNFAVVQDNRGVIYAGNADGVLEFDGARWRLITTPRRTAARSLAVDPSGRIYVGAQGEIGYLSPDDTGEMAFVSLTDRIPEKSRTFEDVWATFATADGVYFSTYAALFRLQGDRVDVWKPETAFRLAFLVRDRIFIREVDRGLVELRDGRIEPVPGVESLADEKIFTMAPGEGETIIVGTATKGLFSIDGDAVRPFVTDVDAELKTATLFKAIWLADGRLALGTFEGGVFLLDREGHLLGRLTKAMGLQDQNVKAMTQDAQGGLWLALNEGLSRVEICSPVTEFGDRSGLGGAVICSCGHVGTLYVGTTEGLFRLEALNGDARAFVPVPGVVGETWDLLPSGDSLLVAGNDGVYELRGSTATLVRPSGVYASALLRSKLDPARVFVGAQDGLASMRFDGGRWVDEGHVAGVAEEIRSLYETRDGRLWAGTTGGGILSLALPPGWKGGASEPALAIERYGTDRGLPTPKHVRIYDLNGEPIFSTQKGIFRFDPAADRFEPDARFSDLFPEAPRWMMALRTDAAGRIWMHAVEETRGLKETGAAVPETDGTYRWEPTPPLPVSSIDSDLSACVDDDGVVWFGSPADGLFRYDPAVARVSGWQHPVLVRRVIAPGNRALAAAPPDLGYSDNSLRFEYAGPAFDGIDANRYQVLLEGNDRDWSQWSAESYKEYTNLGEGAYRFRVRARNVYGEVSPEAVYAFRILPPWYRTWWAYVISVAIALALLSALVGARTRTLRRRTVELEAKIAERTAELAASQQEALEANRAKSIFLANMSHELRTPLNAVIGFAQLMGRNRRIPDEERENLDVIARSGEHLLGLINDVLSISKIEAGRLTLDEKPFDLGRMLDVVDAMTRVRSEAKGLALVVDVAPELPIAVVGDEGKLRQVLLNLLGNAVKFTVAGRVTLRARWRDGRASFEVEDTGEGISEAELGTLFEPFVQTEAGRKAKEGTGLGLVISRQIVRLMEGDISVASEPGHGTTFTFDVALPLAEGTAATGRAQRVVALALDGPPPRVLVADDRRENRMLLSKLLGQVGFEVHEAANGAEAVDVWSECQPDLIFMDMRMPIMDGREATKEIRRREGSTNGATNGAHSTKIVALTASAFEHEREEILACGADDFVTKPFREQTIFDRLAEHLGVAYVAEDAVAAAASDPDRLGWTLTPERLATLPDADIADLRDALGIGNVGEATRVAERIGAQDDALGRALLAELRAFKVDDLLELLERLGPTV